MRRAILEAAERSAAVQNGRSRASCSPAILTDPPLCRMTPVDREQVEPSDERRPSPLVLRVGGRLRRSAAGLPPPRWPRSNRLPRARVPARPRAATSPRAIPRRRGPGRRPRGRSTADATASVWRRSSRAACRASANPRWTISKVERPSRKKSPAARAMACASAASEASASTDISASWWASARSSTLKRRLTASRASSYATRREVSRRFQQIVEQRGRVGRAKRPRRAGAGAHGRTPR